MAKIIELIYTEASIGDGTQDSPYRLTPQLWTKDGKLVAEKDMQSPGNAKFFPENLLNN